MRRRTRGVVLEGAPSIGAGVVFDVSRGARVTLGDGCVLGDGCRVHARAGEVRVGAGAVLGERCALLAHAGIEIGARAHLGDEVVLVDFGHSHADVERPVRRQRLDALPIVVGERARVGHRAVIERGVRIAAGASVPAQTLVR